MSMSIDINDRESLTFFYLTMKEKYGMDKIKSAVFLSFVFEEETHSSFDDDHRGEFIDLVLERMNGI